jgi:phenylalanine-4-hydroxylase
MTVTGDIITGKRNLQGKIILISFKNCTVTHYSTILFKPENGIYDLAVGKDIVSAFSGPADLHSFNLITHKTSSETIHLEKSNKQLQLEVLYQQVRDYREGKNKTISRNKVLEELIENHPNDWLLPIELFELAFLGNENTLCESILKRLEIIKQNKPKVGKLIDDGLEIIRQKVTI